MVLYADPPGKTVASLEALSALPADGEEGNEVHPPLPYPEAASEAKAKEVGKRTWGRIGKPISMTKGQKAWMDKIRKGDLSGVEVSLEEFIELRDQDLKSNPRSTPEYRKNRVEAVG